MLRFKPTFEDISTGVKIILTQQKDIFPIVGVGCSAQLTMPEVSVFPKGNGIGDTRGRGHDYL